MAINVLAWNTYNSLSDPHRLGRAIDQVEQLGPDVALFDEAYDLEAPHHEEYLQQTTERFEALGYAVTHTPYDDPEHYETLHGIMAISRLPVKASVVRVELRNSLDLTVVDPETRSDVQIVAVHFDHKNEDRRVQQATEVVQHIKRSGPTIVGGDLNAMHGSDGTAKLLRSRAAKTAIAAIPNTHARDQLTCLRGMAKGEALRVLEKAGLHDADPEHRATMLSWLPLVQLDHFMISDEVEVTKFKRLRYNRASDHRAIQATFEII